MCDTYHKPNTGDYDRCRGQKGSSPLKRVILKDSHTYMNKNHAQ